MSPTSLNPVKRSIDEEPTEEKEHVKCSQLAEDKLQDDVTEEKLQEDVKRPQSEKEKMLADIALLEQLEELLNAADVPPLPRETARAPPEEQDLERTIAAQADSIDDITAFIASGCSKDTPAYNRIMIRHLLNLTKAKLAYCSRLSTTEDVCAAKLWRQYCSTLRDVPRDGWVDTKVCQVKRLIREKRHAKDVAATNALFKSGALELLVNDTAFL